MSGIEPGNIVPLRPMATPEDLGAAARLFAGKQWALIERASDEDPQMGVALGEELQQITAKMGLPPDEAGKFADLVLAELSERYNQRIRSMAHDLVEDFWRALITAGRASRSASEAQGKLVALEEAFQRGLSKVAASFSEDEAKVFREAVDEEDRSLAELRETNRSEFLLRLKLSEDQPTQSRDPPRQDQRFGETVMKTAIRAIVWETVRAIFRTL